VSHFRHIERAAVSFATLFEKLLQIERAAATGDIALVRALAIEAEEQVLQLERELIEQFEKQSDLRRAA
jgi:hypothetical protein